MMKKIRIGVLLTILVLLLSTVSVAAAQDDTGEPAPVDPEPLTGTVIAVDEEAGTITLLTEDGETVTVALGGADYEHPIIALLADYFGGPDLEDYADALDTLEVALEQEDGTTVVGTVVDVVEVVDEEGNITWEITVEGEDGTQTTVVTDDEELAADLIDALDTLQADLEVAPDEEGNLVAGDVGDEIEAYHEEGLGFGVIVKLYAIAGESQAACEAEAEEAAEETGEAADTGQTEEEEAPCGVTVEELVEMFSNGTGLGQLFQEYGRPALLGIGHIRQELREAAGEEGSGSNHGICNAREHGGNANAYGQNVECP